MNAAEQVKSFEVASKVSAVVNLFKAQFPDAKADLRPWAADRDTQELVDPDSIDIGFHFPGWSPKLQSRSILLQIRFYTDPITEERRAIGIEAIGFAHHGKQWQLSTIDNWQTIGTVSPRPEVRDKLKHVCNQIFELFNGSGIAD